MRLLIKKHHVFTVLTLATHLSSCGIDRSTPEMDRYCDDHPSEARCVKRQASSGRSGGGSNSLIAPKLISDDCIDPDLSLIASSQLITLCDGSIAQGSLKFCAQDGELDCVSNHAFPAVDSSSFSPADIRVTS